jgi:hypothetical protein
MTLNEVGFENVALHAMIRQKERLAALAQFRSNIIRILIATDVASRGMYQFVLLVFIVELQVLTAAITAILVKLMFMHEVRVHYCQI